MNKVLASFLSLGKNDLVEVQRMITVAERLVEDERMGFIVVDDLLDLEDVRAWLESLPEDEYVGTSSSTEHCPLAVYLQQEKGACEITTRVTPMVVYANYKCQGMPSWAKTFIAVIDSVGKKYTAQEALDILETVEEVERGEVLVSG